MEAIAEKPASPHPFNSALETGIRAVLVLDAMYPRKCGLNEMVWFDHLVVHTEDIDGPPSLHPALPARTGELLVRRRIIEESLHLMQQVHLVDVVTDEHGVRFVAAEDSPSFIDCMQSPYSEALKERARWLAQRFSRMPEQEIEERIEASIGRWTAQFAQDNDR